MGALGHPHPEFGFREGSVFSNLDYLLNSKSLVQGDREEKRAWPWIIWFIWKSRNDLLFKGMRWDPEDIQLKAKKEAAEWFLAQKVEEEITKHPTEWW